MNNRCPLCANDTGRDVWLRYREATEDEIYRLETMKGRERAEFNTVIKGEPPRSGILSKRLKKIDAPARPRHTISRDVPLFHLSGA